jgi:hypothetical protein
MSDHCLGMRRQTLVSNYPAMWFMLKRLVLRGLLASDRRQVMFRSAHEAVEAQDMARTVSSPEDAPMDEILRALCSFNEELSRSL